MEDIRPSPPVGAATRSRGEEEEASLSTSGVKKGCLDFLISVQEGFGYVKAFFVGQTKKITAKNEKEATRAELETSKMQVEATDAAESTKKHLDIID